MPYLSFLSINYDIPVISEVITWFESCIIRSYANPVVEHQILLSKDALYKEQFIRALNDMDIDITGYRYDEDTKQLFMQRTLSSQEYELPFSQESDGPRSLSRPFRWSCLPSEKDAWWSLMSWMQSFIRSFALCHFPVQK